MEKNPDSGCYPRLFFQELINSLGLKILKFFVADPYLGSGIFLTLDRDPGWKNSGPG
jgi:hypothetical protein